MAVSASSSQNATAFVVVVPTGMVCDAKLLRWRQWAADASAMGVAFHVLLDGEPEKLSTRFWNTIGESIPVHRMVNESTVLSRFEGMQWGESSASGTPGSPTAMKLQWYIHFPFYLHWWEHQSRRQSGTATPQPLTAYEYVWFIEHDVFFGGPLTSFLAFYAHSTADLIDAFTPRDTSSWHAGAFNWPLPARLKRHKWEHVERFSRRLAETLRDLLELRISAYGEVFESSVCGSLSWCTMRNLAHDGFVRLPFHEGFYNGNPMKRLCFQGERDRVYASSPELNFSGVWTHKWVCSCTSRSPKR